MYAIAFDLKIDQLKKEYGDPYNRAYDEIRQELERMGFLWIHNGFYTTSDDEGGFKSIYRAIQRLSRIGWFRRSVRDIRAFKVEDWSDFTDVVREED